MEKIKLKLNRNQHTSHVILKYNGDQASVGSTVKCHIKSDTTMQNYSILED